MTEPKLVTEIVGDEPYEYYPMGEYVVRAKGVCGGRPTFKYTRIEVAGILAMLATDSIDQIVEDYGGRISREAIVEAIRIAGKLVGKSDKKFSKRTAA
jgi:uncharacterized protein (DUF433 family)